MIFLLQNLEVHSYIWKASRTNCHKEIFIKKTIEINKPKLKKLSKRYTTIDIMDEGLKMTNKIFKIFIHQSC